MQNEQKFTSLSSIILIVIKELRLERNIHQAHLAEICNKTPSAWTKIETGKTPLAMEVFLRVCNGLTVPPSAVLATAERYAALLSQNNWGVMSKQLDFPEDTLLKEAQQYYLTSEFKERRSNVVFGYFPSILNGPRYHFNGAVTLDGIFLYVLNENSQKNQEQNNA